MRYQALFCSCSLGVLDERHLVERCRNPDIVTGRFSSPAGGGDRGDARDSEAEVLQDGATRQIALLGLGVVSHGSGERPALTRFGRSPSSIVGGRLALMPARENRDTADAFVMGVCDAVPEAECGDAFLWGKDGRVMHPPISLLVCMSEGAILVTGVVRARVGGGGYDIWR